MKMKICTWIVVGDVGRHLIDNVRGKVSCHLGFLHGGREQAMSCLAGVRNFLFIIPYRFIIKSYELCFSLKNPNLKLVLLTFSLSYMKML